jgi:hypothetical protein
MVIKNKYFEEDSTTFFNITTMVWPIIWIPYFYLSKRVKSVFKNRNWPSGDRLEDHPEPS